VAKNMKKFLFIKIFLTLIVVLGLTACKKVHQPALQPNTGNMLQVELNMPKPWKKIVIGPTHTIEYPNVPQRFSMFITGESTGALKPYLLIEDSTGKEYSILLAMRTGHYVGGKTLSLNLRHADKTSHNKPGVFPLNNLKPPLKLKGISFNCRKPLRETIFYFDNLKFDDIVIENFDSDSKWRVIAKEGRGSKGLLIFHQGPVPGRGMEGFVIPEPFPDREGSLTSNTSFEKDNNQDGMPDSWFHANRENLMPLDSSGKSMFSPKKYEGKIAIEMIGAESPRSVSISVADEKSWAAVSTILKDVKPNTDYTVSLWYRQPKAGDAVLILFGTKVKMDRQFELNSEHWIRYSGIFNSGSFSGDCNLAVGIVKPEEPTKVYVDKLEIYEGWSPIGYNRARMQHYYYSFAEVSPDMKSYVPFAYECLFEKDKRPKKIQYILEVPEDITVEISAGWYMRRWPPWFIWRTDAPYKTYEKKILRNDRPYVQHSIILPKRYTTGPRDIENYIVPVGVRDVWKSSVGGYTGQINLAFELSTNLKKGKRKAYYYAKWNAGRQEPQELELRVVRVPEVKKPLKRMVAIVSLNPFKPDQNPDMIQSLRRIGVNGIAGGSPKEWGPGMRYYAAWVNFPMYHSSDPEAYAMGIDGKRKIGGRARCMTYRGQDWKKYMNDLFQKVDQGYNVFMFDDAKPATCYDTKGKAEFSNMLKKHTTLPYIDPVEFMKFGWSGPEEYKTLWNDFQLWMYGFAAKAMKDEMIAHAKKHDKNDRIYFLQSASPVRPIHEFAYATTHKTFDFEGMQSYIYCFHLTYRGSPKMIGDQAQQRQKRAGKYANPIVPTLSPGLTYMHPANSLDPNGQMKYQILESAMAHKFLGYNIYAGGDIDLGDLRYIAEANEILSSYEDIFIDGEVIKGISVSGKNSSARIKRLGDHVLMLVADYSSYQHIKTQVKVTLPENLKDRYTDVESEEELIPDASGKQLTVNLYERRARMFYGGPGWKQ